MQQLRQKQIHGQIGTSLDEDIKLISDELQFFDPPVRTKADLPMEGNHDGNIRVVLNENAIYCWDEELNEWISKADTYTETVTKDMVLAEDGQIVINTKILVGQINGMVSIDSVQFFVNGHMQKPTKDYVVTIDTDFNCVIEWKSRDFQLEISDTISLSYDALRLS